MARVELTVGTDGPARPSVWQSQTAEDHWQTPYWTAGCSGMRGPSTSCGDTGRNGQWRI